MANKKKSEGTNLVKLDSKLYNQIREYVKLNKLEYPSIKNFVENAVTRALGFKQYDIEGIDSQKLAKTPLSEVVGKSSSRYVPCALCNKLFISPKGSNIRVCQECSSEIMQVVDTIVQKRENKRKEREVKDKLESDKEKEFLDAAFSTKVDNQLDYLPKKNEPKRNKSH